MGFLEKKYGISGSEVFRSVKNDFLFKMTHLSRDEKDAVMISSVIHLLIFILILVAPYTTNMDKLKKPKQDSVVIFDLDNLKLSEKDNLPSTEVKEKPAPKKKEVAKKPVEENVVKKEIQKSEAVREIPKVEQKATSGPKGGSLQLDKNKSKSAEGEKKIDEKSKKIVKNADPVKSGSMEDLFKSIDEIKTSVAKRETPAPKPAAASEKPAENLPKAAATNTQDKSVASEDVSASYISAIKYKIKGCWNIDPGAKGVREIIVTIDATLTPDGSIDSIRLDDMKKYGSDSHFKAAADSAKRALIDCSPYNLPMDRYSVWKEIRFNFSPSRGAIE